MIKALLEQGVPKARIAEQLQIDRKTVARHAADEEPPAYARKALPSILDPYKPYIQQRLAKYELTAMKLFAEIHEKGYDGSYPIVQRYVQSIRPPKPASAFVRFETAPGQQAQVDWSPFGRITYLGQSRPLSCFAMVLGYSRVLYIEFTVSQDLATLTQCHLNAFRYVGGVPRELLYDQMKTVVLSWSREHIEWHPVFREFARTLGFEPRLCLPGRKETKGKIERPFGYVNDSFFAGLEVADLDELNGQARHWLDHTANQRVHRTTQAVPFERLPAEQLQPLPERVSAIEIVDTRKSHKDCFLKYQGNRYSVPFQYACRELTVRAQGDTLRIYQGETLIATHSLCRQRGQMVKDPAHFAGLRHPAYLASTQALQAHFLDVFPQAEAFIAGVVRAKGGNVSYHLTQILALTELYPATTVSAAVQRALEYGAFNARTVRNICQNEAALALPPPVDPPKPRQPIIALHEWVAQHSLARYEQVAEEVAR